MKPRTKIEIRLCGENGVDQKITINLKELYRLSYLAKLAEMPLENFLQLITCDEQGYVTGINLSKPTEANKDRIITSEYFQRLKYVREGKAERKILEAKRESFFLYYVR